MKKRNLILGIGNIARRDDGVGVHVVNYILDSGMYVPEDIEVVEAGAAVYDILPLMIGRKKVVIIDALKVDDLPGSIYRVPSDELKRGYWNMLRLTPHLREIIFQCFIMRQNLDIDLIGIVPGDIYSCSLYLSENINKRLHAAAEESIKAVCSVE